MILKGLEEYMIPCVNKAIFGVECLGCGMQRATALLFYGEFAAAILSENRLSYGWDRYKCLQNGS